MRIQATLARNEAPKRRFRKIGAQIMRVLRLAGYFRFISNTQRPSGSLVGLIHSQNERRVLVSGL